MGSNERDQKIWLEIEEWENRLYEYQPTDIEMTVEKWIERSFDRIDPEVRERFFRNLDSWLFHIHAQLQGSQSQIEAKDRIVSEARIFNEQIIDLSDLRKLSIDRLIYLADQQIVRSRFISFAQGGLAGTGGILLTGSDIPAMAIINLRAVQLIATAYGYDVRTPFEMMISLKLFHIATLPKRLQAVAWDKLVQEIRVESDFTYFYEGDERLTNEGWMKQPLKQLLKTFLIISMRKKMVQGLPLLGMAIGAGMNYRLTRTVTDFAQRFYQKRVLLEKMNDN